MKYKYVPVFISYDKVADKMNRLAARGYEYDKEAMVAIRIKVQKSCFMYDISLKLNDCVQRYANLIKCNVGSYVGSTLQR